MDNNFYLTLIAILIASIAYLKNVPIKDIRAKLYRQNKFKFLVHGQYAIIAFVVWVLSAMIPVIFIKFKNAVFENEIKIIIDLLIILSGLLLFFLVYTELRTISKSLINKFNKNMANQTLNIKPGDDIIDIKKLLGEPFKIVSFENNLNESKQVFYYKEFIVFFLNGKVETFNFI
jgi:cytochrome c biogenesis protein CcdA